MNRDATAYKTLMIVGCGYVGLKVAELAKAIGIRVVALTRSEDRVGELTSLGIVPHEAHWLEPSTLNLDTATSSGNELESQISFRGPDWVLVSVPHRADGGHEAQTHVRGLENLLHALSADWSKLIYLSTTGVFGSDATDWVDERTPVSPNRIGPEIAVAAEEWILERSFGTRATVVRLAGIYGPGRIPLAEALRLGQALPVSQAGHLNLAHRDDIATMILQVFQQEMSHPLYVFSDGQPVLRSDFYQHLATLCGVSQPKFSDPDPNRAKRATDKRVNPARIVNELHFKFQFPDYRSGLQHSLSMDQGD